MQHPRSDRALGAAALLALALSCAPGTPSDQEALTAVPPGALGGPLHDPAGLVAHWAFDEGSGTTIHDSSLSGIDLSLFGAKWVQGRVGGALAFDGGGDVAGLPGGVPAALTDLDVGTVSLWFRFESIPGTNQIHPILHLGAGSGAPLQSAFVVEVGHFETGTDLYFTILDRKGHLALCFDSGFDLSPAKWYHFAAVVGPDFNTGYLDGVELVDREYNAGDASTSKFVVDVVSPDVLWLGRGFLGKVTGPQEHHGAIDEVRFHSRPLTAAEVGELYAEGVAP
mgnify:FL=1